MSNLLLQKFELLRVTEVGKIILKKKRPLLLARSVYGLFWPDYERLWTALNAFSNRVVGAYGIIGSRFKNI